MECSAAVMLGRPLSLHFEEIDAEVTLHHPSAAVSWLTGESFLKISTSSTSLHQAVVSPHHL